jgi:hypothetical protein
MQQVQAKGMLQKGICYINFNHIDSHEPDLFQISSTRVNASSRRANRSRYFTSEAIGYSASFYEGYESVLLIGRFAYKEFYL